MTAGVDANMGTPGKWPRAPSVPQRTNINAQVATGIYTGHCRRHSSCVHRHAAGRDYAASLQLETTEFD
jgi:hypothetical protein